LGYQNVRKLKINKNMPRFDATGPSGFGPGTGRGMGPCGAGMGYGRGRGFGRGFGGFGRFGGYNSPYPTRITKEEETEMLNNEVGALEEELKAMQERLAELKNQK